MLILVTVSCCAAKPKSLPGVNFLKILSGEDNTVCKEWFCPVSLVWPLSPCHMHCFVVHRR